MGHTRPLVACAGERGKVIICDYSKKCTQDQGYIHFYKNLNTKDKASINQGFLSISTRGCISRIFLRFIWRQNQIRSADGILNFDQKIDAHEYSIFDVEWVQGQKYIATASSDLTSNVICVETGKIIAMQRGKHESSIVDLSGNILVSGGRDGKISDRL